MFFVCGGKYALNFQKFLVLKKTNIYMHEKKLHFCSFVNIIIQMLTNRFSRFVKSGKMLAALLLKGRLRKKPVFFSKLAGSVVYPRIRPEKKQKKTNKKIYYPSP